MYVDAREKVTARYQVKLYKNLIGIIQKFHVEWTILPLSSSNPRCTNKGFVFRERKGDDKNGEGQNGHFHVFNE